MMSGCPTGKVQFDDRKAARKIAAKKRHWKVRAYVCQDCGSWHLGHLPQATKLGMMSTDEIYRRKS